MPPSSEIVKGLETSWKMMTGNSLPAWILHVLGFVFFIWILLYAFSLIRKLWITEVLPAFYKPEQKQRRDNRQRFAEHIESEIQRLNRFEDWNDYRFTELEAEVEAEGRRKVIGFIPLISMTRAGLRRERSLTKALEVSQEPLVLLEGEPGTGKSVALRHVTITMSRRAKRSRRIATTIPIYINLKELKRDVSEPIDRNLIEKFVLQSLKKINDRNIDEFLDKEFARGLKEGTWFFLFDSFDELPDIIGFSEANATIRSYAEAIADFLGGMNHCKGIIASRHFRGPGQSGWPRFRILPLTDKQCLQLVRKFQLGSFQEKMFIGLLGTATSEIYALSKNPMYLGLLCEHVKNVKEFPQNTHSVFESHITNHLARDEDKILQCGLVVADLRNVAEHIAFCMTADQGVGLSPTRTRLEASMNQMGFSIGTNFHLVLDTLEYIKIARSEMQPTAMTERRAITFSHRRFQEYFATCMALKERQRINEYELLTNSRWRETAVVMCQTQPIANLSSLIDKSAELLKIMSANNSKIITCPVEYVDSAIIATSQVDIPEVSVPTSFAWPPNSLHLLSLLQDGFGNRLGELPHEIRLYTSQILLSASENGTLVDRKWALEVSGTALPTILTHLLRSSFSQGSVWLWEVAYRQTARLKDIPQDIAGFIRYALYQHMVNKRLYRDRYETETHLKRLSIGEELLSVVTLLIWAPRINFALHVFTIMSLAFVVKTNQDYSGVMLLGSFVGISYMLSMSGGKSAISKFSKYAIPLLFVSLYINSILPGKDAGNAGYIYGAVKHVSSSVEGRYNIIFVLCFYSSVWMYSAVIMARIGKLVQPFLWALYPAIAAYSAFKYSAYTPKKFAPDIGYKLNAPSSPWKLIVPLLVITGILLGIVFPPVRRYSVVLSTCYNCYIWSCIVWVWVGPLFPQAIDWITINKWQKERHGSIDIQQIMKVFGRLRTGGSCIRLIRITRENDLLVPTRENIDFIKRFTALLEYWSNSIENESVVVSVESRAFDAAKRVYKEKFSKDEYKHINDIDDERKKTPEEWFDYIRKKHPYFTTNWIPELFDETSKLLESLRSRFQNSGM